MRLLSPRLVWATLQGHWIPCVGAMLGVTLTGLISSLAVGHGVGLPFLVAPMGASAVLLFAMPLSPLAQPWSIIGGNTISAAIGITVAHLVPDPMIAAGLTVALAIAAMSLAGCLHPPGGGIALVMVLGGPHIIAPGYLFALVPVALNSVLLVALGYGYHKVVRNFYPQRNVVELSTAHGIDGIAGNAGTGSSADVMDAIVHGSDGILDIDREDDERLRRSTRVQRLRSSFWKLR
jgi:CBS domain-containing membrane protein